MTINQCSEIVKNDNILKYLKSNWKEKYENSKWQIAFYQAYIEQNLLVDYY